jgi:hypothetical protein
MSKLHNDDNMVELGVVRSVKFGVFTSPKTGKDYTCVFIRLNNDYEKMIFLDEAEIFMLDALIKEKLSQSPMALYSQPSQEENKQNEL